MRIVANLAQLERRAPTYLAVGFFDGVHTGHQTLLRQLVDRAHAASAEAMVLTYWPHPAALVPPYAVPPHLTTRDERLARLQALGGLDTILDLDLTPEHFAQSPDAFLADLSERINLREIVTGPHVSLPVAQPLDLDWLRRAGARMGFALSTCEVTADGAPVSAARIRALLTDGEVGTAPGLLGADYALSGLVVDGDKRGRLLGFPTANLRLDPVKLVPARGIYAVWARVSGEPEVVRPAVASVGVRPTFGQHNALLVEVYLLDVQLDLYGQTLEARFVARLREERRYSDVDALIAQMHLDVDQARIVLDASGSQLG